MKAEIATVPIGTIDPNPFRLLGDYPYSETKLETLKRSINDVGLWEGVIGRHNGNRIEIAFGHHRIEAAKRAKLAEVNVIVKDLTEEQMLQYMGRENLEEYNAEFLVLLETWEAAYVWFKTSSEIIEPKAIEIARLLGWTRIREVGKDDWDAMNVTAAACNAALHLIEAGHIRRNDLAGLPVFSAREIVERTHSRIERLEKTGREQRHSATAIKEAQHHVATAAKSVAKQAREGKVAVKDLRARVDLEAFKHNAKAAKPSPLFAAFAKALGDQIQKLLASDSIAEKLVEMQNALHMVVDPLDVTAVKRIDFELENLGERVTEHRKRLDLSKAKNVMPLRTVEG
jgi:hypothetical protein